MGTEDKETKTPRHKRSGAKKAKASQSPRTTRSRKTSSPARPKAATKKPKAAKPNHGTEDAKQSRSSKTRQDASGGKRRSASMPSIAAEKQLAIASSDGAPKAKSGMPREAHRQGGDTPSKPSKLARVIPSRDEAPQHRVPVRHDDGTSFDRDQVHVGRFTSVDEQRAWFSDALRALVKVKSREVIAIQPDLSSPEDSTHGLSTSLWMIEETIAWVKRRRGTPLLLVAPGPRYHAQQIIDALELEALAKRTGTELVDARKGTMPLRPTRRDDPSGRVYRVQIATLAADGLILLPKLKTARYDRVALSLWGLLGVLSQRELYGVYRRKVVDDLVELYRRYQGKIRGVFVDGIVGLEADGPTRGRAVDMGVILAGRDAIAVDAIATMCMGFDPEDVEHLLAAQQLGLGHWQAPFTVHPTGQPLPVHPFQPAGPPQLRREQLKRHPIISRAVETSHLLTSWAERLRR